MDLIDTTLCEYYTYPGPWTHISVCHFIFLKTENTYEDQVEVSHNIKLQTTFLVFEYQCFASSVQVKSKLNAKISVSFFGR